MDTKMANRLKRYGVWGLLLLALLAGPACERKMAVPAYLYVDSVCVSTQYATQGSSSANITDVWVTVDGKNIGVYELPATIPVLASGEVKVQLQAGIKKNGISSLRPVYPFYTSHICYPHLEKRGFDTLVPSFTYHSSVSFDFKEDFEDAGIKFTGLDSSKGMSKISDKKQLYMHPGEVNHFAGCMSLTPRDSFFEVVTNVSFKRAHTYTFLEMDYCTTNDMEVGIYYHLNGRNIQSPICGVYRTGDFASRRWKKIYINLTEAVNGNSLVSTYEVYFKSVKPTKDSAVYLFDNIKIVNM